MKLDGIGVIAGEELAEVRGRQHSDGQCHHELVQGDVLIGRKLAPVRHQLRADLRAMKRGK